MSETQLDRIERKLDSFVEYVQARFEAVDMAIADLRSEMSNSRAEFEAFRIETREKLESLSDRLTLVERGLANASDRTSDLRRAVSTIAATLHSLETTALSTNLRILELRDDMQQRFRLVNDRLASLEKKLAA